MPRPTGSQFVRLYRGLSDVKPSEVDLNDLGSHWTTEPWVAHNFLRSLDLGDDPLYGEDDSEPTHGSLVIADIHKRHIIDPNSEEGKDWQDVAMVLPREHAEREFTVRPGALVHIRAINYFDDAKEKTVLNEFPVSRGSTGRA